jgi:predicted phosphodiesterase
MKFSVLHLSDIHLRKEHNSVIEKIEKICLAIKSELFNMEKLFLVISGDVAFSGNQREYEIALELVESLKSYLINESKLEMNIIMVPGNHDCNFTGDQSIRNVLLGNIRQNQMNTLTEEIIQEVTKAQSCYIDFEEAYDEGQFLKFRHKLFKQYVYNIGEFKLSFNCLNTSWISELHEQPSKMYYPLYLFDKEINELTSDLKITVMHHPLHWLEPTNNRLNKDILEANSDIILTGHEHVPTFRQYMDFEGNYTGYIEGGALQTSNPEESEFNLIQIDIAAHKQRILKYSWLENKYLVNKSINWTDLRIGNESSSGMENNEDYNNYLNDPGLKLNHPKKAQVYLDDIYIYPDARVIKFESKRNDDIGEYINLEDLKEIKEENKFFITGEEKSGKSTFCKTIYKFYRSKGYVPVLINGRLIKSASIEEFNKVLYKTYCNQYSSKTLEEFKQLPDMNKLIIIDDYDKINLNNKFSLNLLINIDKYYKNIIITGNELFKFFELLFSEENDDFLDKYGKYEIMQFGHRMRGRLISQWNSIGDIETLEESEFISKNDHFENTVNTIIGNNYVPSFPFFILIMMQTLETGSPHNLAESTYGFYYEHLIRQSFIDVKMNNEDIDAFYNYITELAFVYFEDKVIEKSIIELKDFHRWYSEEYDLTYNFDKYLNNLINTSILEGIQDIYKFKYNYTYYYFVARYFAINISESGIRDSISKMCKKLYYEEYANIIMFLTHLSKDPFILNEILENTRTLFNDFEPTKLEEEIDNLNKLISEVPNLVIDNKGVREHRDERLEYQDQIERNNNEVASTRQEFRDEEDGTSEIDIIGKLNWSFKTLEILGLILKNYYGSIKGSQKVILGQEAYFLGLRSLSSFLGMIDTHMEAIVREIEKVIENKHISDKHQIQNEARKFVFNLCCAISFQFIKKISNSVGTDKLTETFKRILNNNNTNAIKLIDISIKLDHIQTIPFSDITSIKNELDRNNNLIVYNLLRGLVIDHLYMFETNYKVKQRICSYLDISIERQRKMELISNQKK